MQPQQGRFSISGPQDAIDRFSRPVAGPAQQAQVSSGYDPVEAYDKMWKERIHPSSNGNPLSAAPKYLGLESGLGWKTRLGIYKEQMDAYNRTTGNQAAMDVEAMRESGAGARALLTAKGVNDANQIARQRLVDDAALNSARIGTEGINQQKGQMEVDAMGRIKAAQEAYAKDPSPQNESILRGLTSKFEREAQYGTIGRYDDQGMKIGEDLYSKATGELKSGGNTSGSFETPLPLPKSEKEMKPGSWYVSPSSGQIGFFDGKGLRVVK